jgi:hypothetical protein
MSKNIHKKFVKNQKYSKLRQVVKPFLKEKFNINVDLYDWYHMKTYYCKSHNVIKDDMKVINTQGYSYLKNDWWYLAVEIPHKTDENKSIIVYWTDLDDYYILVQKSGNIIEPICVSEVIPPPTTMKVVVRPNQFKKYFPKFIKQIINNYLIHLNSFPSSAESILDNLIENASEIEDQLEVDLFDYLLQEEDIIQRESIEYYVEGSNVEYVSNLFSKIGSLKENNDHYFYLRKQYGEDPILELIESKELNVIIKRILIYLQKK